MTTYTQEELATKVLRYLNLVDVTEAPDAAIMADTVETITADIATIELRDIPIWNGSALSVPIEYLVPLTIRLSIPVSASYGMINPKDVPAACIAAEQALRELSMTPATGAVAEAEYF